MGYATLKRILDGTAALIGLILLSPILLTIAICVRITMGSPVIFRQVRPGRDEKPFGMLKFRTMTNGRDQRGAPLPDDQRLTRIGCYLRKTSLDELPELINVLKGEMSLVGPRPLITRYSPYFTEEERLRFTVRPGITGWAQVHGRNESAWDERLARDVWYVKHRSLLLDCRILVVTLYQAFRGRGVVVAPKSRTRDLDEERRHLMGVPSHPAEIAVASSDKRSR